MPTIAPRTHCVCHDRHACVYFLHKRIVCACNATMSFRPMATAPGASGHAHTYALPVPARVWSLRAAGLALDT